MEVPTTVAALAVLALALLPLIAIGVVKFGATLVEVTEYASAWDHFINRSVGERWVVVTTRSGQSIAGCIGIVDTSVRAEERDIILCEPAWYDTDAGTYTVSEYSSMFLLGSSIASIAAVAKPATDKRITTIGGLLFLGETDDASGSRQTTGTGETSTPAGASNNPTAGTTANCDSGLTSR